MKKIYFSLASIIMCGGIIAQNAPQGHFQKAKLSPNSKVIPANNAEGNRAAGPFSRWVEPVGDVMYNKGLTLDGNTPDQDLFIAGIFQDSTVQISSPTSTRTIDYTLLGTVLDPKSTYLDPSFEPIVSTADSYTIDSLFIYGSYVKVTPAIDTLYVWLVWGDSTNTSVFSKRVNAQTWVDPIGTWRASVIGPKITGATGAAGNKVSPSAPSSNSKLIKYALQDADSSASGYVKLIILELDSPVTIPAGNIVSCVYGFVPGGTYNSGDCSYSFTGASVAQNTNGFAGGTWGQVTPAVTTLNDYVDHQVDPSSWCMGTTYMSAQRHNVYWGNFMPGDLTTAAFIGFKISGNSTVGINEPAKVGFNLSQNTPNPFTNKTTINYQLNKVAKNVSLEVYDVRGVKMFDKTQTNLKQGNYSEEINSSDFTSGVYFYTLNVDGNKITKKMIVR